MARRCEHIQRRSMRPCAGVLESKVAGNGCPFVRKPQPRQNDCYRIRKKKVVRFLKVERTLIVERLICICSRVLEDTSPVLQVSHAADNRQFCAEVTPPRGIAINSETPGRLAGAIWMRHSLTLVLACALLVSVLAQGCSPPNHGKVQIVNATDAPLSGEVDVCRSKLKFAKLPVGGSVTFDYDVGGGQDYHVVISEGTSKPIDAHVGYITGGFDFDDKITIHPSDIEIEDKLGNVMRNGVDVHQARHANVGL